MKIFKKVYLGLVIIFSLLWDVNSEATIYLRYATASQEIPIGFMLDNIDGNTEETGLTIANTDIKIWKTGNTTLASKNSGGATHISNGIYYATLDDTDTNTVGSCKIFVHVSGALAREIDCMVLPAQVYDSIVAGSDLLDTSVMEEIVEGTLTLKKMLRILQSVLAGKSSGMGTSEIIFYDNAGSTARVTATMDGNHNRTVVTLNGD